MLSVGCRRSISWQHFKVLELWTHQMHTCWALTQYLAYSTSQIASIHWKYWCSNLQGTGTYHQRYSLYRCRRHKTTCKNVHGTREVINKYERRKRARHFTVKVWDGMYIDITNSLEGVLKHNEMNGWPGSEVVMNIDSWWGIAWFLRQLRSVFCADCFYIK